MAEPTTRFAHLLQPIRDLSKVWKIEIAGELEKYIEEVSQLLVTNPDDGVTQLNFAEAALLIQGSTAVYSRKVELLYQLVYQALDMLALDKAKDGAQGKRGKPVQTGLWAPIPETEELLTIDHLIKEGRNILMEPGAPEMRQAMQRRVPLFLMPRDQNDRAKKEFRISSCTVHSTGVYLLQESDAKLLDDLLALDDRAVEGACGDAPLVPAPPREVQDLDDRLQVLLRELPEEPEQPASALAESPKSDAEEAKKETPAKKDEKTPVRPSGAPGAEEEEAKRALPPAADPWALLDEHDTSGQDLPLEVGRTSKRLNAKKLLTNAEGLPDVAAPEALSDAALWSGDAAVGAAPMLAAGHPVESLFLAVAGHMKAGGRYEVQRQGFSAAWLEFEDLFAAAAAKRRTLKMTMKAKEPGAAPSTPQRGQGDDGEASDEEGVPGNATPVKLSTPTQLDPATPGVGCSKGFGGELSEEAMRLEEQRREVAMLENMIQDAQSKYESTIRQHLQSMHKDGVDADNRKFPQLYANVRKWQDQLEPVLKEFESRPEFDIHTYSTKFLAKMTDLNKAAQAGEDGKLIPFARLVHGQPRWEVCRRFLTCLILTNHGNTDIVYNSEEERLNKFSVKLLNGEKKWISLEDETGAPAEKVEKARGKKSAAPADAEGAADAGAPAPSRKRQKKA